MNQDRFGLDVFKDLVSVSQGKGVHFVIVVVVVIVVGEEGLVVFEHDEIRASGNDQIHLGQLKTITPGEITIIIIITIIITIITTT